MEAELRLLWSALVAYVLAGTLSIFGVVFRKSFDRTYLFLMVAGLLAHALSIGLRWERVGHGPVVTMFEILVSNLWSLLLVFVIAYWRVRVIRPAAAIVMPLMFIMMGWLLMTNPGETQLPATFHTVWLYIHIGFGKVYLGSVLVAVGLSAVILCRRQGWGAAWFGQLPDDLRLTELAFRFIAVAFIFDSLMLIAGAIWAQDAWGRYWSWDPLETWSFITWLLLAMTLHARLAFHIQPRAAALMIIAVFVVGFLTLFGVPFISAGPHKGTF